MLGIAERLAWRRRTHRLCLSSPIWKSWSIARGLTAGLDQPAEAGLPRGKSRSRLHVASPGRYRLPALESGLSFEDILQTLEQHGMRSLPPAVQESLRTWANKRERISVYPAATLFEFGAVERS